MTVRFISGTTASVLCALCMTVLVSAAAETPVADAAMQGDRDRVRVLLKQAADVNAAQGDGMTALHWAAMHGDHELVQMLMYAGANPRASSRINGYTPLFLASRYGHADAIEALLKAGANPNAASSTSSTPLMLAAASGNTRAVTLLLNAGANINGKEAARDETPVMFAAAHNRVPVIELLAEHGADLSAATKVVDLFEFSREEESARPQPSSQQGEPQPSPPGQDAKPAKKPRVPGVERGFLYTELIGYQGGFTPLLLAAREGHIDAVTALLNAGASINHVSAGDKTSPLLVAAINGHFDLATFLLDRGADPTLASENGVTPLYAVLNCQWAPKSNYPQPRAYLQQKLTYLDLMTKLLEKGADPNVRLKKKVWYSGYNSDLSGVDESGATPFWRAAYASDVDAMRLLVAHGSDPSIPSMKPAGRPQNNDSQRETKDVSGLPPVPVGGPSVTPLQAASGVGYAEGFAANSHRIHQAGWMPAVKYLVEELGADVNAVDHAGNTALHHAAARGDVEMILHLVSQGANVTAVNREGQTTADMANGPVQRTQPYPEALALLVKLGAINNNKCVSC